MDVLAILATEAVCMRFISTDEDIESESELDTADWRERRLASCDKRRSLLFCDHVLVASTSALSRSRSTMSILFAGPLKYAEERVHTGVPHRRSLFEEQLRGECGGARFGDDSRDCRRCCSSFVDVFRCDVDRQLLGLLA